MGNEARDTFSTWRKSILKQENSISVGEFVETGLQKQKEEGGFSYRRSRNLEDEGKGDFIGSKIPSTQSYEVQGETAHSSHVGWRRGWWRSPWGFEILLKVPKNSDVCSSDLNPPSFCFCKPASTNSPTEIEFSCFIIDFLWVLRMSQAWVPNDPQSPSYSLLADESTTKIILLISGSD